MSSAETILCSWASGIWSQHKWSSKKGWFDCQYYKKDNVTVEMKDGEKTYWGQCVRETGDWGTCSQKNGSMGACNWTSDPEEMRPKKWARCEFQDKSISKCFYCKASGTFSNCTGNKSAQDGLAKCHVSTGYWAKCLVDNGQMTNCTWGAEDKDWHYCMWDSGYASHCPLNDTSKCNTTQVISDLDTSKAKGWGLCAGSDGVWGFCNKTSKQCIQGMMQKPGMPFISLSSSSMCKDTYSHDQNQRGRVYHVVALMHVLASNAASCIANC